LSKPIEQLKSAKRRRLKLLTKAFTSHYNACGHYGARGGTSREKII